VTFTPEGGKPSPPPVINLNLTVGLTPELEKLLRRIFALPGRAVAASMFVKGDPSMSSATFTVDTTDGVANLQFTDDKGDTDAAAPAGLTAAFTSDNPAACTIANDATNPLQGDITVVGEGVANISVALTDANGNSPPLEADGVTPWAAIDPVQVTVDPGAAVGARLSVTG
jgi:hypothetical protein